MPPTKTIFPDSSLAKRLAVRAMRLYGRALPSIIAPLKPTDSPDVRILIQSMGGIGNTIMATPLIAETRRLFPNARIDVLTSPGVVQLLAMNPHVSAVIADPPAGRGGTLRLISTIRAARYDAAIAALNSHLPKFATRIVLGGIPRRLMHAYAFKPYDDFTRAYTHVLPRPKGRHDVRCNLDLLSTLTGAPCEEPPLTLALPAEARIKARERLVQFGWREGCQTIGLFPGSSGAMSFKRWPFEQAIDLVDALIRRRPESNVVVMCGPDEAEDRPKWKIRFSDGRVLFPEGLDLPEYAAAIGLMDVVVTNDSLPMHIAAAQQRPVVALFGPTDPAHTGPWHSPAQVITSNVDYAPYYQLPYPLDPALFPDCMKTIAPAEVYSACIRLLDATNAHRD